MKKIVAIILVLAILMLGACICARKASAWGNNAWFDTTYTFDRAIIFLPDGAKIEGRVQSWQDYENSDVVQVKIDGIVYLTHYSNVILISE